jgi:diaminohydroxyphosphoribosylaminopyrimidine deaminase/5-amino-6-(5-phosphoribosylamino)uracil reductase
MVKPASVSDLDREMMQSCLQLARLALGKTAPNPMVGSIIVKNGQIIGRGFHPQAGQPHAEVFALREAGEQAQGATLYVNLEPCNHYGKTPPCTEAIMAAGIEKVIVGMVDPNPLVAGKGIERLRLAGILVEVGIEEAECQRFNEAFIHRIQYQRPWGILKYAMTLDGKIATHTGHSTWVTGKAARDHVHQTRAICEAVIVGGNTVRKDNPQLTSHGISKQNPLRVVMSRSLDLPEQANLWDLSLAPTVVCVPGGANPQGQAMLRQLGVEVVELEPYGPDMVMQWLYEKGCLNVLWECGGTLAARAIAAQSIQKVMAFIAPKIIGGPQSFSPIGELGFEQMTEALALTEVKTKFLGEDILIEGYLARSL